MVLFVELKPLSEQSSPQPQHWLGLAKNLRSVQIVRDICMSWKEKIGSASIEQLSELFLDGLQFRQLMQCLVRYQEEDEEESEEVVQTLVARLHIIKDPSRRIECLQTLFDLQLDAQNRRATCELMLEASVSCKAQIKRDLYLHIADALASSHPKDARWILEALLQSSLKIDTLTKAFHIFRKLGDERGMDRVQEMIFSVLF